MHIHFMCSGNVYRSRLAEAYFNSLTKDRGYKVTSSGTVAARDRFLNGPIDWYAMRIIKMNNLIPHMAWRETQTTSEVIAGVDLFIFMKAEHLEFCRTLGYTGENYEIWDIPDMTPGSTREIEESEKSFELIKPKVEALTKKLI